MTIKHKHSVGMGYEEGKKTAIRHAKEGSGNTVDSMVNQVRLHEGEKSAKSFKEEVVRKGLEQRTNRKYI